MLFGGTWRVIRQAQQVVSVVLFIGLTYLLLSVLFSDKTPNVHKGAVLLFNPVGMVVEQTSTKDRLDIIFETESARPPEVRMRDIAAVLQAGKTDDRISALALDVSWLRPTGFANAHYIAQLIEDFKESGKPVIAYGNYYGQTQYLLVSHADELYLNPAGSIFLTGIGIYPTYFKEGLEKLGAEVNIFRIGEFKSAVDGYMFNEMPEATRLSSGTLINGLWENYINWVSTGREFENGHLQNHILNISSSLKQAEGNLATLALNEGLVDELITPEAWLNKMQKRFGKGYGDDRYLQIDFYNYLATQNDKTDSNKGTIGVVIVEGPILDGEQPVGTAGGETVARHLRAARMDAGVKAVVLRVNSPGGSSFASEQINNEVELLKAAGKPVVVSMGSYAASGGYWVAAKASEIFAMPSTVTGSIGIFAVLPTFSKTLEKIGIKVDGIGTTPLAAGFNVGLPMSDPMRDLVNQSVNNGYQQFIELVSNGRGLEVGQVDAIGRGRVWSGSDALEQGLVDKLGNFDDALQSAAKLAELEGFNVLYIEDVPKLSDQLFQALFTTSISSSKTGTHYSPGLTSQFLGSIYRDARTLMSLNDPQNIYAICLTCKVQ
jgi:protease-4